MENKSSQEKNQNKPNTQTSQKENEEKKPKRRYRQRGQEEQSLKRVRINKPLIDQLNLLVRKMKVDKVEMVIEVLYEDFMTHGDAIKQNRYFRPNDTNVESCSCNFYHSDLYFNMLFEDIYTNIDHQ